MLYCYKGLFVYATGYPHTIAWADDCADVDRFREAIENVFDITSYRYEPEAREEKRFEGGVARRCVARFSQLTEGETMADIISDEEATEILEAREWPRITHDVIRERIRDYEFHYSGQLTICVVTMTNGYMIVGKSAPASPENYDEALGKKYAYDDCIRQAFQLEGYLLCQQQSDARSYAVDPSTA